MLCARCRTVLLRLASVFVLIITIFVSITRCDQKTCANCQPKVYVGSLYIYSCVPVLYIVNV